MPTVSVIIPSHRSADFTNQAVASVMRQTFTDYEIIVVDDGSGDDVVSRYRFPPSVRLIRRQQNSGGASAPRNAGIRAARGRYLAFLDSDDIWLPDKLAMQVAVLDTRPEVGVTFCHYQVVDEVLHPLARQLPPVDLTGDVVRQLLISCFIRTPSLTLVRRTALEAAGEFDETLTRGEDWGLWLRLAALTTFHADPACAVLYRRSPGQLTADWYLMRLGNIAVLENARAWCAATRPDQLLFLRYQLSMEYYKLAKQQIALREEVPVIYQTVKAAVARHPGALRAYQGFFRLASYALRRRWVASRG
ncbi:MAG: glycosyltransferase family 2 protein [Armatimonadota bacterium]